MGFRSLTESVNITTASGRLVSSIFGALADFERQLIRERVIAGLEAPAPASEAALPSSALTA